MNKSMEFLRKLHETGEMSASELEPGGDWHEFRLELEGICKSAGLKCEVKPFDQYQGPYASIDGIGTLWGTGEQDEFYFEEPGQAPAEGFVADSEGMIAHLMTLKKGKRGK